ncbi:MAG TPA: replication initiator [Marmoricola sp.]|nr:replication initiator [Marmoricola sp.]
MDQPDAGLVGRAGMGDAEKRARGCVRPVRLRGSTAFVDTTTGELREMYGSAQELDGVTYVRCGNRRAAVCPSCSQEYKGDAWHILACGLMGGKGVPEAVVERPCTFVTLTAPSFGAVHNAGSSGLCRPRRAKPVCPHGRPLWCHRRHHASDTCVGEPLCVDCYDYLAHVVWQFHANELWRRFLIALQRRLASTSGLTVTDLRDHLKVSFSKVVEFQARAAVHFHAPIRLDGPDGPDGPPCALRITVSDLEAAVVDTAAQVSIRSTPLPDGTVYELRFVTQLDTRTIRDAADRERRETRQVHPEQVAAYLAKYLTKATEDFGLNGTIRSTAHAGAAGATDHALRLIEVAEGLGRTAPGYEMLLRHLGTLGYRGHPISKSRAYSLTFGQIRRLRRMHRRNPAALDPDADVRQILDEPVPDGFELVSSWIFDGLGYLDLDTSAKAVASACRSRTRRARTERPITTQEGTT